MSGGIYQVIVAGSVTRYLTRLRPPVQARLRQAIRELGEDPWPADSLPMIGPATGLHRLRVGTYRVIYRVREQELRVLVIRVGDRGNVYRRFEPGRP